MKTLLIVTLLCVAVQSFPRQTGSLDGSSATNRMKSSALLPIRLSEVEGAPQYPASRIVNGQQASRGQFPYQVALYADGGIGGASLISSRWVLTAAHCVDGYSSFALYLGALDRSVDDEEGRLIIVPTRRILHPDYNILRIANDIALMDLGVEVSPTTYIQPIPLATGDNLFEGVTARVSGWGMTSDVSTASDQLNYADFSVISNDLCARTFGSLIQPFHLCTLGIPTSSICTGDSGGPLVDLSSGKQIGVVSFMLISCENASPGGYARVSSYIEWISNNTGLTF